MIDKRCFNKEWYQTVKGEDRSDINIIERQIYALHLLETLLKGFNQFIFKGGTCLSLISDDFPRFSVDIDILVHPEHKSFFTADSLSALITQSEFISVKENVRAPKHDIDKKHFEFYYRTYMDNTLYILLDIVFGGNHYERLNSVEINNYLIDTIDPQVKVTIPAVSDLIADKLCAFAPHTTGKRLGEERDLEVIKQMYDVSFLMDNYRLSPTFHESYVKICEEEIKRRQLSMTYHDILLDTITTSANILTEGKVDDDEYLILKNAVRRFTSYTRNHEFTIHFAKIAALKNLHAALLVWTKGNEVFMKVASQTKEFDDEYHRFISAKKILRQINLPEYDLLNDCLKVMTEYKIELNFD